MEPMTVNLKTMPMAMLATLVTAMEATVAMVAKKSMMLPTMNKKRRTVSIASFSPHLWKTSSLPTS